MLHKALLDMTAMVKPCRVRTSLDTAFKIDTALINDSDLTFEPVLNLTRIELSVPF